MGVFIRMMGQAKEMNDNLNEVILEDKRSWAEVAREALSRVFRDRNGSLKQSTGKVLYSLIPPHAKEGMALAFMDGARKYAPGNWKLLDVETLLEANERHATAIRKGEVFAPDSKLQHAAHMMAGAAMVYELLRIEMGGEDLGPKPTPAEAAEHQRLMHAQTTILELEEIVQGLKDRIVDLEKEEE